MMKYNRKCPQFCSFLGCRPGLPTDAFLLPWLGQLFTVFPPTPLMRRVLLKVRRGRIQLILIAGCTSTGSSLSSRSLVGHTDQTATVPGSDLSRPRSPKLPEPQISPPPNLETLCLNPLEWAYSGPVHKVLLGSRKQSTRATYLAKWKIFLV